MARNHRGFLQKKVEQFRRGFVPGHSPGQRSFKGLGRIYFKGEKFKDEMGERADYCMNKLLHSLYC